MQKKLIVVADDFTGCTDTGVQFVKAGLKVHVIINTSRLSEEMIHCDVLVVDLESRLVTPEQAYRRSFEVGRRIFNIGNCVVYKKLDSTLRGNIGAEIDGLMDALQLPVTLLAPAWPASGRTTENGEVIVHGIKLENTEAARDPRTPVKHSAIASIIGMQSTRVCRKISTAFFESGQQERDQYLTGEINKGSEIFIFDSREEADLERIAYAIDTITHIPFLIAGSAGLASHLWKTSLLRQKRLGFVFAGSISEVTRNQIRHTLDEGNCTLIFIDGEKLLHGGYTDADETIASVADGIAKGHSRFIFTAAVTYRDVESVFLAAAKQAMLPGEAAARISFAMGGLAATLIAAFQPSGVLLTGGETAINTVNALGATGISIGQEILQGVQSGTLTGCPVRSVIATKAGNFGQLDAISKTFEFFKV